MAVRGQHSSPPDSLLAIFLVTLYHHESVSLAVERRLSLP